MLILALVHVITHVRGKFRHWIAFIREWFGFILWTGLTTNTFRFVSIIALKLNKPWSMVIQILDWLQYNGDYFNEIFIWFKNFSYVIKPIFQSQRCSSTSYSNIIRDSCTENCVCVWKFNVSLIKRNCFLYGELHKTFISFYHLHINNENSSYLLFVSPICRP